MCRISSIHLKKWLHNDGAPFLKQKVAHASKEQWAGESKVPTNGCKMAEIDHSSRKLHAHLKNNGWNGHEKQSPGKLVVAQWRYSTASKRKVHMHLESKRTGKAMSIQTGICTFMNEEP